MSELPANLDLTEYEALLRADFDRFCRARVSRALPADRISGALASPGHRRQARSRIRRLIVNEPAVI
jgi:hypothetical protein